MEGIVEFSDWEKVNLVVGQIVLVEEIVGADKLYKLSIDVGNETRTVCAGLKEHYSVEDLTDKKIILFKNLKPRMMRGIESQGMILAACSEDHSKVVLISPEKDVANGSRVS